MKQRMTFAQYQQQWEDAAANAVAHGGVAMPADAMTQTNIKKHKKRVSDSAKYDGRTKEGKKFVRRILASRNTREQNKLKNKTS
jgi:hypothetical protein